MRVIFKPKAKLIISHIHKSLQIPCRDRTPKWHSATLVRRCMLVGVLSQIGLFSNTHFVSPMTVTLFCCFQSCIIIIIIIAAMLHVFVRYLLYLLLLQCLFPGENKIIELN